MRTIEMSDYCEDHGCKFYGEKLVDLGYGYPVCRSTLLRRYPIPMEPEYQGFKKYYKVVKCNEAKPKRSDKK